VPVVSATARQYSTVAAFSGVGVLVTTRGVTQLPGRGVAVPSRVAWAVCHSEMAAAVAMVCAVGVLVMIT
jgi:hypothetical protein